jgi:hypothetical protein
MSRLTKIGLCLIPWWPLLRLVMIVRKRSDFIIVHGATDRTQFDLHVVLHFLFLSFVIGLIFLLIAYVGYVGRLWRMDDTSYL